ncbi:MAG: ATP synthase A1 subunit C [Actinobacteria bacterium]|nr:ATP synthase A1 subunit C [Actinomycetota bacterium]
MAQDYGYPNARIRGMKSYLLDRIFYEKLLDTEDISSIILMLEKTPYKKNIEEATIRYAGVRGVEEALRINVASTYSKILDMVEKESKELVKVLLGRWDVYNIKTILRGKHVGVKSEDIAESLVPAGELEEALLLRLVKQPDLKIVIDLLATWGIPYSRPLTENFPAYAKNRDLVKLELALDKFYFAYALAKTKKRSLNHRLVNQVLAREVDTVNIMTVLKTVKEEIEPGIAEKLFIEGGKEISKERFLNMAKSKDVDELIKKLSGTSYFQILSKNLKKAIDTGNISVLQRGLEEFSMKKGIDMFKADPLSIALIIGYLSAKYNEIVNLRIIVRGKEVGMPQDRIREALVIV